MDGREIVTSSHPAADEIAAWAENRLPEAERAALEAHFADCPECRREATEVGLFLRERRSRRGWAVAIPALAAAAAASILLLAWPTEDESPSTGALRSGATGESLPPIEIVEPRSHEPVDPDSLRFVWREVAPGASYRVSLTDAEGTVVWEDTVPDTTVTLPSGTTLRPGSLYFWYVDALGRDANVASSGVLELRTRVR